jgi:hypothetical protein
MRTAEVGNWSGLALVCPRTDLARLTNRREVHRTGVYILVGPSDTVTSATPLPVDANAALLRFTQEYPFASPSGAASVVSGTGLNGRAAWKVKGIGISYGDWEDQQVSAAEKGRDK